MDIQTNIGVGVMKIQICYIDVERMTLNWILGKLKTWDPMV